MVRLPAVCLFVAFLCTPLSAAEEEDAAAPGFSGFVVLPDGSPAAGAEVVLSRRWEPGQLADTPELVCGRAVCDEDGRCRIVAARAEGVLPFVPAREPGAA